MSAFLSGCQTLALWPVKVLLAKWSGNHTPGSQWNSLVGQAHLSEWCPRSYSHPVLENCINSVGTLSKQPLMPNLCNKPWWIVLQKIRPLCCTPLLPTTSNYALCWVLLCPLTGYFAWALVNFQFLLSTDFKLPFNTRVHFRHCAQQS